MSAVHPEPAEGLDTNGGGRVIEVVAQTGSTSADLAARLRAGEHVPEGHWRVADSQTCGRGRQGREWLDGAGNFMGSTVVRSRFGDPPLASLSLLAGVALHEVVAPLAPTALLKWPNDLMVGTAKLAGILIEGEGDCAVVGIGVNLVNAPHLPDRTTIALSDLAAAPPRDEFAVALAQQFDLELERWRNFGLAPIVARWLKAAHPLGTALTIEPEGLSGTFAGLTPDGALQLRLGDGTTREVHAGEVRLAGS
jgi:BirA family transcriptional regulator, biotin operon repressor / biotin---[acetyl-CoA-carboxylase] ligase